MRFFLSRRLPFGLRAGFSIPVGARAPGSRSAATPITGSFVYVIRGEHNLIKVGISTNPIARIAQLRTASPFPIKFAYIGATNSNGAAIEAEAHHILRRYRTSGEWFDVSAELAIAAVNGAAAKLSESLIAVPEDRVFDLLRLAGGSAAPAVDRISYGESMFIVAMAAFGALGTFWLLR